MLQILRNTFAFWSSITESLLKLILKTVSLTKVYFLSISLFKYAGRKLANSTIIIRQLLIIIISDDKFHFTTNVYAKKLSF